MLIPVNDNVVVLPLDNEEKKTETGIILKPDKKRDEVWRGEVVAVQENEDIKVSVGDIVLYDHYEAKDLEYENRKLQVVNYDRILSVIQQGGIE